VAEMSEYERGVKEGRVEALLDEHTARLNKINGSIDRFSKSHDNLAKAVSVGIEKLASEMRTMQEDARLREAAVKVAADTLATETERRRVEEERLRKERADALEVPVRAWGLRANKANVLGGSVTAASTLAAIYFAFH
jgi:hypothetical protein